MRAFEPSSGVIACQGPVEGGPCPRAFVVRVDDPSAQELMQSMHLDHTLSVTHDVGNICSVWRASIPPNSRDWCRPGAPLPTALQRLPHARRPRAMPALPMRLEQGRPRHEHARLPLGTSALRACPFRSPLRGRDERHLGLDGSPAQPPCSRGTRRDADAVRAAVCAPVRCPLLPRSAGSRRAVGRRHHALEMARPSIT